MAKKKAADSRTGRTKATDDDQLGIFPKPIPIDSIEVAKQVALEGFDANGIAADAALKARVILLQLGVPLYDGDQVPAWDGNSIHCFGAMFEQVRGDFLRCGEGWVKRPEIEAARGVVDLVDACFVAGAEVAEDARQLAQIATAVEQLLANVKSSLGSTSVDANPWNGAAAMPQFVPRTVPALVAQALCIGRQLGLVERRLGARPAEPAVRTGRKALVAHDQRGRTKAAYNKKRDDDIRRDFAALRRPDADGRKLTVEEARESLSKTYKTGAENIKRILKGNAAGRK